MKKTKSCKTCIPRLKYKKYTNINPLSAGTTIGLGAASGAASGALAGSAVPGVGTAVGAIVGGVTGAVGGILDNESNKAMEKATERAKVAASSAALNAQVSKGGSRYENGKRVNPYANRMEMGTVGEMTSVDGGGSHEENVFGGVPIGIGENGKINTVEEGEQIVNIGGKPFVFGAMPYSDSGNMPNFIKSKGKNGKQLTYKEVANKLRETFKDRNDTYSRNTYKALVERLAGEQLETGKALNPEAPTGEPGQNQMWGGTGYFSDSARADRSDTREIRSDNRKAKRDAGEGFMDKYGEASTVGLGLASSSVGLISNIINKNNMSTPTPTPVSTVKAEAEEHLVNRRDIITQTESAVATASKNLAEKAGGDFGAYASNVAGIRTQGLKAISAAMVSSDVADAAEKARVEEANMQAKIYNAEATREANRIDAENEAEYVKQKALYNQGMAENISAIGQSFMNYGIASISAENVGKGNTIAALGE